jgi:hypothetical protein
MTENTNCHLQHTTNNNLKLQPWNDLLPLEVACKTYSLSLENTEKDSVMHF